MKKAILWGMALVSSFILPAGAVRADLLVSEIMYDWPGTDDKHEWVEFYNGGGPLEAMVGSSGQAWRFFDGAKHLLNLYQGTTTIAAFEYFILADNAEQFLSDYPGFVGTVFDTAISLSNATGSVAMSLDGGTTQAVVANYDSSFGAGGNGNSLEKINLSTDDTGANWQESFVLGGTPGTANSQRPAAEPQAPQAVATCPARLLVFETGRFDAGGSTDANKQPLTYLWNFSDGNTATTTMAQHAFATAGTHAVSLTVNNGQLEDAANCTVEVVAGQPDPVTDNNQGWSQIVISEFLPNPAGKDDGEWIELYNRGPENVNLNNFSLQDNSTRVFKIEDHILPANNYLVLYKNETGISLNNTGGDSVRLFDPTGNLLSAIVYQGTALEGKSYARINDVFNWTNSPTPGTANILLENQLPVAKIKIKSDKLLVNTKIIFSAEDSFDPEDGELIYEWDFGDGSIGDKAQEKHVYESAGVWQAHLKVTDDQDLSAEAQMSVIIESANAVATATTTASIDFTQADLIISEFLPNPVGSDDQEWGELYNASNKTVDISGWQLDDADGGSRPYVFPVQTIVGPGGFLVVNKSDSKLSLNNQKDSVRLLTPASDIWQEVSYENVLEGQSQAWDLINQEWFISPTPSPGQINVVPLAEFSLSATDDLRDLKDSGDIWLELLALQDSNPQSRSLYASRFNGEAADYEQVLELYFSKKQWPGIKAGNIFTASGQISNTNNGTRLKISSAEQIVLSGRNQPIEKTETIDLNSLNDELVGTYLSTGGTVVKKSGKNIYLASSVEEDSVLRAYLDFDYKDLDISKGKEVLVSGILQNTTNGWKLLVKNKNDVLMSQEVLGHKESSTELSTSSRAVLGEKRTANTRNFLLVLLGAVVMASLIYFIMIRRRRVKKI